MFVLASIIADDGDRDGLPNVLMEAQSQGLACLATRVSAVPELIEDAISGALVPPADAQALMLALHKLITEPEYRVALAQAGQIRVREQFDMSVGIKALLAQFDKHQVPRSGSS